MFCYPISESSSVGRAIHENVNHVCDFNSDLSSARMCRWFKSILSDYGDVAELADA